jgi:hypothetical protein
LLDSLALVIGAGAAIALDGLWTIGLIATLMFALDAKTGRRSTIFAGVTLLVTLVISVLASVSIWQFAADTPVVMVVVAVSVAYGGLLLRPQTQIAAVGDMTGEPLEPRRVRAAQWLAPACGVLFFLTAGSTGIIAILPLWAAMLGLIVQRLIPKREMS